MKSLSQIMSERLNAMYRRRYVGGVSKASLAEGVSLDKVTDWFKVIYSQVDDRIDRAKSAGETEMETDLRNFRSVLRDYEPRPGMDSDEATQRMSELYTALRNYPEEYSGTFRAYMQKVVDQVDKAAKTGIIVPEPGASGEEFGMETPGEEELPGELGGLGGMSPEEEEMEKVSAGEEIPGTEGAVETGEEVTI